jgi:hypothetical protein
LPHFSFVNQYSLGGDFRFQKCWCLGTSYLCVTLLSNLIYLDFRELVFLHVGCVTTWSRDLHHFSRRRNLERPVDIWEIRWRHSWGERVVQGKFNNQVIFYMEVELENGGGVNLILKHLVIVILNVFFFMFGSRSHNFSMSKQESYNLTWSWVGWNWKSQQ